MHYRLYDGHCLCDLVNELREDTISAQVRTMHALWLLLYNTCTGELEQ